VNTSTSVLAEAPDPDRARVRAQRSLRLHDGCCPAGDLPESRNWVFSALERKERPCDSIHRCVCAASLMVSLVAAVVTLSAFAQKRVPDSGAATAAATVAGIECSRIAELGYDKAGEPSCRLRSRRMWSRAARRTRIRMARARLTQFPLQRRERQHDYRRRTFPAVTQSESSVWTAMAQPSLSTYNDSRTAPANYSGVSVSTDGPASRSAGSARRRLPAATGPTSAIRFWSTTRKLLKMVRRVISRPVVAVRGSVYGRLPMA